MFYSFEAHLKAFYFTLEELKFYLLLLFIIIKYYYFVNTNITVKVVILLHLLEHRKKVLLLMQLFFKLKIIYFLSLNCQGCLNLNLEPDDLFIFK